MIGPASHWRGTARALANLGKGVLRRRRTCWRRDWRRDPLAEALQARALPALYKQMLLLEPSESPGVLNLLRILFNDATLERSKGCVSSRFIVWGRPSRFVGFSPYTVLLSQTGIMDAAVRSICCLGLSILVPPVSLLLLLVS